MEQKHTFRYEVTSEEYSDFSIELSCSSVILSDVIESFEQYLRGCGFVFDGRLDLVPDNDEEE